MGAADPRAQRSFAARECPSRRPRSPQPESTRTMGSTRRMTPAQARAFGETLGLSLRYALDSSRLPEGGWRVVQFDVDLAAARYIEESRRRRHGRALTWLHRALRGFLSDFDINGYLGTYPMHVLSEE